MHPETVLVKTPRGREEIRTRAHPLSALQRRLLILADGRRSVDDMTRQLGCSASDAAVVEALVALERGHFVDRAEELEAVA